MSALEKNNIVKLFDDPNKELLKSLLDVDIDNLIASTNGTTRFRLLHLTALSEKESPNDYLKYEQVKMEYYNRIKLFIDLLHQYNKAQADMMVIEAEIDELNINKELSTKLIQAKIAQHNVENDRLEYQIFTIKKIASAKLAELNILKEVYDRLKYIDDIPQNEKAKLEEEGYRIKSAYFQELIDRYGLTPQGFIKYPHEEGGLKGLLEVYQKNINKYSEVNKNVNIDPNISI